MEPLQALFWIGVALFAAWQTGAFRIRLSPTLAASSGISGELGAMRGEEEPDSLRFYFRANGWNRRGVRILVEPETEVMRRARSRGLQDLEVGRAGFDLAFLVRSSEPRIALRALDERVQDWAIVMANAAGGGDLVMKLEPLVCEVRKELPRARLTPDDRSLLEGGARAWAQAVHAAVTGAAPVHAGPPPRLLPEAPPEDLPDTSGVELGDVEVMSGECQLCGDAIEAAGHPCPYCGVPHHVECWDFHGGCTTYGCPGTP
jgi:hypothetical protein